MRTNEERIAAMHTRAAEINRQKNDRRVMIAQTAAAVVSLAAVIALALFIPQIAPVTPQGAGAAGAGMNASIFGSSEALGYIVTGVIAFLFGTCMTVFCFRLKRWKTEKDEQFTS